MSFKNATTKLQAQRGFTIVELLIVIVVIAILAAITIVSYNGITTRANAASAKATAATFQKKAELYQADGTTGKYPVAITDLTSATSDKSFALTAGNPTVVYVTTPATLTSAVTSTTGTGAVGVRKCAASGSTQVSITSANITGLEINYWDYTTNAMSTSPILIGTTTVCPQAV